MLEKSRAAEDAGVQFSSPATCATIASVVDGMYGAAICVGNVLPHLSGDDDLSLLLATGLRRVLLAGAPLPPPNDQLRPLRSKGGAGPYRSPSFPIPTTTRPRSSSLRTMDLQPDGPRHLHAHLPSASAPTAILPLSCSPPAASRSAAGGKIADRERVFTMPGFSAIEALGTYQKAPFDPGRVARSDPHRAVAARSRDSIRDGCERAGSPV